MFVQDASGAVLDHLCSSSPPLDDPGELAGPGEDLLGISTVILKVGLAKEQDSELGETLDHG